MGLRFAAVEMHGANKRFFQRCLKYRVDKLLVTMLERMMYQMRRFQGEHTAAMRDELIELSDKQIAECAGEQQDNGKCRNKDQTPNFLFNTFACHERADPDQENETVIIIGTAE